VIQERRCPRCAIKRTLRLAHGTSFCFNCRSQWEAPIYPFKPDELARLELYRVAVRAGFYSDR
jgi:ribosomal protein L37AE/L43A